MPIDEKVTILSEDSTDDTTDAKHTEEDDDSTTTATTASGNRKSVEVTSSGEAPGGPSGRRGQLFAAALAASLIGNGALGWLAYDSQHKTDQAQGQLSALEDATASKDHAMAVAIDYAKGAAEMDYKDLPGWTRRLTTNTSPELTARLKEAAASMEQIIVPLQWVSTPTPIASVVRSERDGVFVVNAFVSVKTKNVQTPDGIQSTATYTVTINKNSNWTITDVGGVDTALKAGS